MDWTEQLRAAEHIAAEQGRAPARERDDGPLPLAATPFAWADPATIPARQWLYGRHLIRGQASVTVGPGAVAKSSLTIAEGIAMASGRELLGEWVAGPLRVWLFNLEDPADEMQRRVTAAMLHHGVAPAEVAGRLFVDSGRERGLCTATVLPQLGVRIVRPEIEALEAELQRARIDVLIVDPFVSSHQVPENDNSAIDLVAKAWAALAGRCSCAIELVHHTRKLNGDEGSSEAARGGNALLMAARSGRVLNRMNAEDRSAAGIPESDVRTYFSVTRDKANLAPASARSWYRTASVDLGQGDLVGVVEAWAWPSDFDGVRVDDLLAVQRTVAARWAAGQPPRFSDQAGDEWIGHLVAEALGLDATTDGRRIKRLVAEWLRSGALRKVVSVDGFRKARPFVEVGAWATE